jgi:hypothetical protein
MTQGIVCWKCGATIKKTFIPQHGGQGFKSSTLQPIYMLMIGLIIT